MPHTVSSTCVDKEEELLNIYDWEAWLFATGVAAVLSLRKDSQIVPPGVREADDTSCFFGV